MPTEMLAARSPGGGGFQLTISTLSIAPACVAELPRKLTCNNGRVPELDVVHASKRLMRMMSLASDVISTVPMPPGDMFRTTTKISNTSVVPETGVMVRDIVPLPLCEIKMSPIAFGLAMASSAATTHIRGFMISSFVAWKPGQERAPRPCRVPG